MKTETRTKKQSPALSPALIGFAALGAYFAVLLVGSLLNGDKMSILAPKFIIYMNPLTYAIAWLLTAAALVAYGAISKPLVYRFTWIASFLYALRTAMAGGSYYLTFAMCGLVAVMTYACGKVLTNSAPDKKATQISKPLSPTAAKVGVAVLSALTGGGVLFLILSSYLSFTTSPTAGTSVYIQLLESLRSGFSFDTTLEFGESVSHMAAHISPIFLLYLPFYAVIPSPVTLLVLQVAAVYSAVIPLWLIARRRGLSPAVSLIPCALLCLFPAIWGGTVGSFHEYALLLPLLLWLIWAYESDRPILVWVFAALTLCLRETCAVHLFTLGLYWLITNRKAAGGLPSRRTRSLILMGVSAVYLITALIVLTYAGKGTLITRFENVTGVYATDFGTLIRELFCNPAIALYEMLTEAKLHYVLCMLLPLGLLPLLSHKKAGLVFLLPFLLLNLLSDFPYHFSLDYPYSFGVAALGLYLCVVTLCEYESRPDHAAVTKRAAVLALCFAALISGFRLADFGAYAEYTFTEKQEITALSDLLESVDDTASVSASGRLIPHLAARKEIYGLTHDADTEFVVLDLRSAWIPSAEKKYTVQYFEEKGYSVVQSVNGVGAVLQKK
ncbi:MAG: DUF2079 domain-containing protein [Ruminococcaceae bacterium]|nr:DUF2079 domain-containing protein [Oscillospiraceae bacterium]